MNAVLGKLTLVPDQSAHDKLTARLGVLSAPAVLSFINAHGFNLCWTSPATARLFAGADMLVRDGVGMALLCRAFGHDPGLNMIGTDFIPHLLHHFKSRPIALFGTKKQSLEEAAEKLRVAGITITSAEHGFHPPGHYIARARQARPAIIVLGMGMPRQEQLAAKLRAALEHPCLIVNGGAILDMIAGRYRRAPAVMREHGLEWLFRLALEPRRLFTRYIIGNALFLARLARLKISGSPGLGQPSPILTPSEPPVPDARHHD
jgi:exopolysaccharide biosynthesis WecB/TagA/CpsF family protein